MRPRITKGDVSSAPTPTTAAMAPVSKAALAAGADGLIIEVHNNPSEALSDAAQQLKPDGFGALMNDLRLLAPAVHRTL